MTSFLERFRHKTGTINRNGELPLSNTVPLQFELNQAPQISTSPKRNLRASKGFDNSGQTAELGFARPISLQQRASSGLKPPTGVSMGEPTDKRVYGTNSRAKSQTIDLREPMPTRNSVNHYANPYGPPKKHSPQKQSQRRTASQVSDQIFANLEESNLPKRQREILQQCNQARSKSKESINKTIIRKGSRRLSNASGNFSNASTNFNQG